MKRRTGFKLIELLTKQKKNYFVVDENFVVLEQKRKRIL
jgi:hypothetical protein